MSNSAYQLQFAAELLAMLVAVAGLVLVLLRADLTQGSRWARGALALGFVAVGTAAFLHGSLLSANVSDTSRRLLGTLRLGGDAAVAVGCLRWNAPWRVRLVLWLGLSLSAGAAVVGLSNSSSRLADLLLIVGSTGVAVALVVGSRRSIVARVASGAAGALLLMVLVLSVALSSVIANSTQQNQLASLASRAREEGGAALADTTAIEEARFVTADLQGYFRQDPTPLIALHAASPDPNSAKDADAVSARLGQLASLYPNEGLAYVIGSGKALTPPASARDQAPLAAVAGQSLVRGVTCASTSGQSEVLVAAGAVVVAAAFPQCLAGNGSSLTTGAGDTLLGVVVVVSPLDDAYLTGRQRLDPTTSLTLVAEGAVVASAGPQPATAALRPAMVEPVATNRSFTWTSAGRELAAEPLTTQGGRLVATLVASTTDQSILAARNRLERTLFLIALGGTVLALLFVAAIGDRITAGLRRLTEVSGRIARGGTGERADIEADDEVGALGAAFDSMVGSIERQTEALQIAANDETKLRNRLEAVVAGMGDALIATDGQGQVTEFNAAAARLTGVAPPVALGAGVRQVLDLVGEDGARLTSPFERPPTAWTDLAVLRRRDNHEIPVAVSAGVVRGPDGEPVGGVLVLRDLRREQEVERMKTEFLSRVGHELRTPLTAIMGYSEILIARQVSAAQSQAWHQEILDSAKRLARIVELLEFFASSGAGRVLLHPETQDPTALVQEVAAGWADRLGDRHSLVKHLAPDIPSIKVDRRWVGLALDELMDNAVKFSPNGGPITLGTSPSPEGSGVDITVTDRGMGMTPREQSLAFGEFVQGDSSDTRRFGGLGLGLALVQRVIDAHDGTVLCESRPGAGSRLTIRLPAVNQFPLEMSNGGERDHAPPLEPGGGD